MKIYKYVLEVTDEQYIKLPKHAKFLSLQAQNEKPCAWFLVDENCQEFEPIKVITYGTGMQVYETAYLSFLGTYQLFNGNLVYHVWAGL